MSLNRPEFGPVIHAVGLERRYGSRLALGGLSLDVAAGSVFGLLGPNGSGKSTFLMLVAAQTRPDGGSLEVFGEAPGPAHRGRIGTVFQENAQDPLMTAEEHLLLAARMFGRPGSDARERARRLLDRFGLEGRGRHAVSTLSGGMRRRLEMARALVHDPDLVLLDEPTTGVDPGERRALWDVLVGEEREPPRTIVLATNDMAEADGVCDTVAFIKDGRTLACGTPKSLKRDLRRESVTVSLANADEALEAAVRSWPGVGTADADGDTVHVTVDDASAFIPRLFEANPGVITGIAIRATTLEDAYFHHIGGRGAATGFIEAVA